MAAMVEPRPVSRGPMGQPNPPRNVDRPAGGQPAVKPPKGPNASAPPSLASNQNVSVRRPSTVNGPVTFPQKRSKSVAGSVFSMKTADGNMSIGTVSSVVSTTSRTSGQRAGGGTSRRTAPAPKRNKDDISKYYGDVKTVKFFDRSATVSDYYAQVLGDLQRTSSMESIPDGKLTSTHDVRIELKKIYGSAAANAPPPPPKIFQWYPRWCLDKSGRHPGQVKGIKGICVLRDTGNIAVTESKNNRIQIFKKNSGNSVTTLGDTVDSFFDPMRRIEPTGLCEIRNQDNVLLVTDKNRVLLVDTTSRGKIINDLKIKDKTDMQGIAMTQTNHLFICEVGMQPSVGVYEESGKLVRELPGRDFRRPCSVSWNDEYEVCAVADSEQHCVLLYDAKGRYLNRFGSQQSGVAGDQDANLIYPSGLCWMPEGRLLVADRSLNKVVLFDLRNRQASTILSKESHQIQNPVALACNGRNRIVLSEEFLDFGSSKYRLKMFKLDQVK